MDTTMASLAVMPRDIFMTASAEEKKHFVSLWPRHLKLRDEGVLAFFIPHGMARRMNGKEGMTKIAENLSNLRAGDAYVYFDVDNAAYRIGDYCKPCDQYLPVAKVQYGSTASLKSSPQDEPATPRIRKPANMWILYRQDKWAQFKLQEPRIHTSDFSKIVAKMWREESLEVRKRYEDLAARLKDEHLKAHPNYKCIPRKTSQIKRRNTKHKKLARNKARTTLGQPKKSNSTRLAAEEDSDVSGEADTSDEESDEESDDERPPLDLNNPKARAIFERCRKDWNAYFKSN